MVVKSKLIILLIVFLFLSVNDWYERAGKGFAANSRYDLKAIIDLESVYEKRNFDWAIICP
jgi:hypothetical protein